MFDQAAYTAKFGVRGSLAGNDTINGLGGDDRIAAGGGNDVVDGGANGAAGDVVVYSGARSNYTITVQGGSFHRQPAPELGAASIPSRTLKGLNSRTGQSQPPN